MSAKDLPYKNISSRSVLILMFAITYLECVWDTKLKVAVLDSSLLDPDVVIELEVFLGEVAIDVPA
jgi:hypothetical protein